MEYKINHLPQILPYSSIFQWLCNLNILSTTCTSVAVDSSPQKATQSLTTRPAPITSDPLLIVPAQRGTCSRLLSSSSCQTDVWGWTSPPLLLMTLQVPTRRLLATEFLKTQTPRVSAMISSVYLSRSGWMRATQSLQLMQLPRADSFSSTLTTLTDSGRELRMCRSSLSVVLLGTSSPFLFPAVVLPTILVPPMVAWTTGMKEPSSLSKTEQKLQEPPAAMRQQPLVSLEKTPISLEFQYCTLFAMNYYTCCCSGGLQKNKLQTASDHFCCRILTTKSVRQSMKELLSFQVIPKLLNIRFAQSWIFLRRTQSLLLRSISFYFSESSSSYLSCSRPWQQSWGSFSSWPSRERIQFLLIAMFSKPSSMLRSCPSRALTLLSASSQSLSCSSILLRIFSGSMMLELDLMQLQDLLTFSYLWINRLLFTFMISERMRWAYRTSRILESYSRSIREGAIQLISPSLLYFSALSQPIRSLSSISFSSRAINQFLSTACSFAILSAWLRYFLSSLLYCFSSWNLFQRSLRLSAQTSWILWRAQQRPFRNISSLQPRAFKWANFFSSQNMISCSTFLLLRSSLVFPCFQMKRRGHWWHSWLNCE